MAFQSSEARVLALISENSVCVSFRSCAQSSKPRRFFVLYRSATMVHEPRNSGICAHDRKPIHRTGAHARLNLRHMVQECHFLSHSALGAKEDFYFTYRLALHNVSHNVTYSGRRSARKETLAEKLNANRIWLRWSKRSPKKADRFVCSWQMSEHSSSSRKLWIPNSQ